MFILTSTFWSYGRLYYVWDDSVIIDLLPSRYIMKQWIQEVHQCLLSLIVLVSRECFDELYDIETLSFQNTDYEIAQ